MARGPVFVLCEADPLGSQTGRGEGAVMRKTLSVVVLVFCGVVGAWVGYWIGHLAGWSQDADWPGRIGGGSGAILLSIGTSVLFVVLAGILVFLTPQRGVRRVLESGVPAQATVVSVKQTGAHIWAPKGTRHQVSCELEVCPSDGSPYRARTTQFVSEAVEGALQPGATVAIRYDPAKPTRVAIEGPIAPAMG